MRDSLASLRFSQLEKLEKADDYSLGASTGQTVKNKKHSSITQAKTSSRNNIDFTSEQGFRKSHLYGY